MWFQRKSLTEFASVELTDRILSVMDRKTVPITIRRFESWLINRQYVEIYCMASDKQVITPMYYKAHRRFNLHEWHILHDSIIQKMVEVQFTGPELF